jgi:hypothetical protein
MKAINSHIWKRILFLALGFTALASCSEDAMDRVNKDNDHTTSAPAKFVLADVITSTAFSGVGGDLNTYFSVYTEHTVGIDNQLYNAEIRDGEPSVSSTFNNVWGELYSTLKNARITILLASNEVYANYTTRGMAEVLAAISSGLITDAFGNTPYSQAALPELENGRPKFMNPDIDAQEAIYQSIMKYLDDAIVDLPKGDVKDPVKEYDLLYKGDGKKWIKLAYGLKARYTMHLLARSQNRQADLQKVLEYVDKSFKSLDEQAAFSVYNKDNWNPLFAFFDSREALAASKSFWDKLVERKDPRLRRLFCNTDGVQIKGTDDKSLLMAPNGTADPIRGHYNTPIFVYSRVCPTMLMSYHELLFLKAEALARLNKTAEAEAALKEAFVAAIANAELGVSAAINVGVEKTSEAITDKEAEEYFDKNVKPLFTANPVREVMVQKYLAMLGAFGESTECYNDIRRMKALKEDFIKLDNPKPFPLRAPYGNSDVIANPKVNAAYGDGQYVYSDPVWWAGGNR